MVGFSLTGLVDNFVNWLPFAGPALFGVLIWRGTLAVSDYGGGHTWTFLDGAGIKGDRAKLRQVIPNFPDSLELPKRPDPILLWD